jgi:tRNA(fMet)-specific endonuclease VapC
MTHRFIFDSNSVSDAIYRKRGVNERVKQAKLKGWRLGTCPPVTGELFFGAVNSDSRERSLRELKLGLQGFKIWPYGLAEAELYDYFAAYLKRSGRPMQVVDMQLASVALTLGNCTVISTDTDLHAIPGLKVENWTVG